MLDQTVSVPVSTRAPERVLNLPDGQNVLVYNTGTIAVRIGGRQDSLALTLAAGSAVMWKDRELWAVSTGAATTLYLSTAADLTAVGTVNVQAPNGLNVNSTPVGTTPITGAQDGATSVGGFTVPDTAGTVMATAAGTNTILAAPMPGKAWTMRVLYLDMLMTQGAAAGTSSRQRQVVLRDAAGGAVLFTCGISLVTIGNADIATASKSFDLLGLAASPNSGVTITTSDTMSGTTATTVNNFTATLLGKAV